MLQGRWVAGLLGMVLCACHASPTLPSPGIGSSNAPAAKPKSVVACRNVLVVDDAGHPLAGATVHTVATAWTGPDGAFYVEGGFERRFESPRVTTGPDGRACVEDAAAQGE